MTYSPPHTTGEQGESHSWESARMINDHIFRTFNILGQCNVHQICGTALIGAGTIENRKGKSFKILATIGCESCSICEPIKFTKIATNLVSQEIGYVLLFSRPSDLADTILLDGVRVRHGGASANA